MRAGLVVLVAVLLAANGAAIAEDSHGRTVDAERALVARGLADAQNGQSADATEALRNAIADRAFTRLSGEEQHQVYATLGAILSDAKEPDALAVLKLATQSSFASENDWRLRLDTAYGNRDYRDAVTSLAAIARHWPDRLSDFNDTAIFRLGELAPRISDQAAIDLLAPMHAAKWRPTDTFSDPDHLWYALALAYLGRHQDAEAADALNDVGDIEPTISVLADRRFDGVVAQSPDRFRFEHVVSGSLGRLRFLAETTSKKLEGVIGLTETLTTANHANEALGVIDATITRAMPGDLTSSRFDDYGSEMTWVLNERARVLHVLGRNSESLDAYVQSLRQPVDRGTNVGQTLNMAEALVDMGRPKDALGTMAPIDPGSLSDFGRMVMARLRTCAYAQLADDAGRDREMEFLRAHAQDSFRQMLDALVCSDDLDGAARLLTGELRDPVDRGTALYLVQDYVAGKTETPIHRENRLRLQAVRNRPDVSAEIAKVGRISFYPILEPGL